MQGKDHNQIIKYTNDEKIKKRYRKITKLHYPAKVEVIQNQSETHSPSKGVE